MERKPARRGFFLVAGPQRKQERQIHLCLHQHGKCCECCDARVNEGRGRDGNKGPFHEVGGSQAERDGVVRCLRELNGDDWKSECIRDPAVNAMPKA